MKCDFCDPRLANQAIVFLYKPMESNVHFMLVAYCESCYTNLYGYHLPSHRFLTEEEFVTLRTAYWIHES